MVKAVIDLLKAGADANFSDQYRQQNLIELPLQGSLVVTGDIHGHRRNFEKIVTYADLKNNPNRHVILQEILHGGPEDAEGGCLSFQLLFDVVRYKLQFPQQVHTIMSNHDTAHINNSEVMKGGKEMNQAMRHAMQRCFKDEAEDVSLAIKQFLFSQALAVKCQNRIWISHSLPTDRYVDDFDPGIFHRQLKIIDVIRPNSAYMLTWGRRHSKETLGKLAKLFDVDMFILGHQPQEEGLASIGENLVIIASDHEHGCLLTLDLSKSYTVEKLIESRVLLASIS